MENRKWKLEIRASPSDRGMVVSQGQIKTRTLKTRRVAAPKVFFNGLRVFHPPSRIELGGGRGKKSSFGKTKLSS
jgi:hypothetical protein